MSDLKRKAQELRSTLPKSGAGKPPEDSGIQLATFQRPEGELRFTWNVYESKPYLRFQLWSKSDDGGFWPSKIGFTIKVKELPDLADGIQKALDRALREAQTHPPATRSSSNGTDLF